MGQRMTDDDILRAFQADIDSAERYHECVIKPKMIARYQLYNGDKDYYAAKFPRLDRKSRYVASDVEDAVAWILPSLIEIFMGTNKIISAVGRTAEDDPTAMEALLQYQMTAQNSGFTWVHQWLTDALKAGVGSVKTMWVRKMGEVEETVQVPAQAFVDMDPREILAATDNGDGTFAVKRRNRKRVVDQPRIINCKPGEHLWSEWVDADGVRPFECHRRYITATELRQLAEAGALLRDEVERAIKAGGQRCASLDEIDLAMRGMSLNTASDQDYLTNPTSDPSREIYVIYEGFCRYDVDGDGMAEDMIVSKVNDVLVRREPNPEGRPPFSVITAFPDDYQRGGRAVADILQDHQDISTALVRQTIAAIAQNNERPMVMDAKQTTAMQDFNLGRAILRMNLDGQRGVSELMQWVPPTPAAGESLSFLEFLEGRKENKIGVTRYNQGLDAGSLNKTAKGISLIMSASQQRTRLIGRIIAETGFKDLLTRLVDLNRRYVDRDMVVRLTGKYLDIRPDDLAGNYDVEVSAGVGVDNPQVAVEQMMLLLTQVYPILAPMGIAGPENFYEVARILLEQMGHKSTDRFLRNLMQGMTT